MPTVVELQRSPARITATGDPESAAAEADIRGVARSAALTGLDTPGAEARAGQSCSGSASRARPCRGGRQDHDTDRRAC
jgi:hypothetical protein